MQLLDAHLYSTLSRGAAAHPERTAVIFRGAPLSYAQLDGMARTLASALRAAGVGPGDRVAALLPNCPPFTAAYFATASLGAVFVPANPQLKPAELEHIWGDSGAQVVFTATPLLPGACEAATRVHSIRQIVDTTATESTAEAAALGAFLYAGDPAFDPRSLHAPHPDSPAVCIYTSGTTGRPKGALLSHRNLLTNCEQIRQVLHFDETDNFLTVLPLFHSFAGTVCQNTSLYCGSRMTMLEQFNPARVLEAVETNRVTIFPGVPAMYGALLQFPTDRAYDLSSVRLCVSGGAPMPLALMQAFEERFDTVIIEGDGPTECSPVTSVNPPEGVRKPGSIGLPLPGVEMRIFDDLDREAPVGEIGEIVVRGDSVMLGYHNQPEATAEAMKGGWYHTGDLGRVDEDGYFFIVDRKKDMLIVGGLNVYPREVEEVLYTHPATADAAVIGAADPLRGEAVVAVIVLKEGQAATEREIERFCRERLANFKVPRRVIFRDSLPRSGTGKILKRLLRKEMDME